VKLLLDTHVWLWSLLVPERISAATAEAIASTGANLHLSVISCWEVMLLAEKGRLALRPDAAAWLRQALAAGAVREIPVTTEIAIASRTIPLPHKDPADRFIAATAKLNGLTLVTSDRALLACPDLALLPA